MNSHTRQLATSLSIALALCLWVVVVRSQDGATRRLTVTSERSFNLNPTISGDGRHIAFESTENSAGAGSGAAFHALRVDLTGGGAVFTHVAASRAPAPALSRDGSRLAFASRENLTGKNADGNSEIFLFDGGKPQQITNTSPRDAAQRINDGNFQPSISDDGTLIAFASNRDLTGANPDANLEVFVYDSLADTTTQITNTTNTVGSSVAKISGDGTRVAFIQDDHAAGSEASTRRNLFLYERASSSMRRIAEDVENLSLTYGRAISDDGQRIVYTAQTAARTSQVFLYDGRNELTRQITSLGSRAADVSLNPTISGDGSRLAFATRRNVNGGNSDASVELYLYDLPTNAFSRLTNAPAGATAEVVSSLNEDGSVIAFNFPRVLSDTVSESEFANNSEIYLASITPRQHFSSDLQIFNGASFGKEPARPKGIAPDQIAVVTGINLALDARQSKPQADGTFPHRLGGATLTVNGRLAQLFYASPTQINFLVPAATEIGTAEAIVRNHDGYESRAFVSVSTAAPGVFTESGDGSGAAIALDSQTLLRSPFDPVDASNRTRRLTIFATGVRHANQLAVTVAGRELTIENVLPSLDLPGLDEIHVVLSRSLAGAGVVPLTIRADGRESNPTTIRFTGTRRAASISLEPVTASVGAGRSLRFAVSVRDDVGIEIMDAPVVFNSSDERIATVDVDGRALGIRAGTVTITATSGEVSATAQLNVIPLSVVLNEILADPPDGIAGDANHDGTRSSTQDEFIEIVNASTSDLNIGGFQITTRGSSSGADTVRHTFAVNTIVAPGTAIVVFGGAQAATFSATHPAFAAALVVTASTGGLSLTNGGSVVKLLDPAGATVEGLVYGNSTELDGDRNQSLTRTPDVTGDFSPHQTAPGSDNRSFSPGTRIDREPFNISVPITRIEVTPSSISINQGELQQFTARALDANGNELQGVIFRWLSGDTKVATIDDNGLARSIAAGDTAIKATARGVQSTPVTLRVLKPQPRIARVDLAPLTASINRGGTLQFKAQAIDQDGRPVGDARFAWSSSNALIATIDAAGLARGAGVGTITISASTSDGAGGTVTGQMSLEVRVPVALNEIFADVPTDDPATDAVEGDANRDGRRGSDDDEFVELFNYSQTGVDVSGLVIADATARRFTLPANTSLAPGRALIVFGGGAPPSDEPSFGGARVFTTSSLGLNDAGDTVALKLSIGDSEITIDAQSYGAAAPQGAPPAPANQSLTRSPDAGSNAPGGNFIAHALAANAATRIYSPGTRVDGTPFDSPPISRISIVPATTAIEIGASQPFNARAYAIIDGVELEVPLVSFAWDSSDMRKASVAPRNGTNTTARALSAGGTLIRASAGGKVAEATLNINPPPPVLTRLVLTPDSAAIIVGGSQHFTAQAFDQYDKSFPVPSITFASNNTAVATIDSVNQTPGSSDARAIINGRADGTAIIQASASEGSRKVVSNTATLTVNPPPPTVTRIEVAPQKATIGVGANQVFTAKAFDRNDQELSGVTFIWATGDENVATINSSGVAKGKTAGTTGVTASSANVTSAAATLTVTPPPVPSAGQVIINEALIAFASSTTQVRRDFIELYNTTGQTLDITGLVISYRPSGSGNTLKTLALTNTAGGRFLIEPLGYFLIAGGANTFGVTADFDASASGFDLNNTTGGIKLEVGGVKLDGLAYQGGSTPPAAPFNAFGEGIILTFTGGTTNDLIRSPNAFDSNNNATDFRRNATTSSVSPKAANP